MPTKRAKAIKPSVALRVGLRGALLQFEAECIARALDVHGGNITHAAKALRIRRQSLQRRVRQIEILRKRLGTTFSGL